MSESESEFEGVALTDEFMQQLFDNIAHHESYKPYKGELEQFFRSRIWQIIQEETAPILAGMFISLLKTPMTESRHAEIASAINIMRYWLNLENNMFAARERALSLGAKQAGGESWTPQP
ncbi:MAG TPA: hypothetical protein ENH62_08185 [Marinobacter sp.]|uniref:Uncharacterized protein n=1 Tax=marine sediment metagenome TaxID=412755 RepID=A0A0F9LDB8_9ZZZZ|nr:hypothetical protein [Marinobacter sp.]